MVDRIQRSFTGGEIAPALHARSDTTKYMTGLRLCENMIIKPQGGAYSRQGTRFICKLDDSSKRARVFPFSFSTEQTYILVFEHLKLRVIKDGGLVLVGAGPTIFELVTPYTEAQLSELGYTQDKDVMTITHPDHDPRDLSRTAHDVWSLDIIDFAATVAIPGTVIATHGGGTGYGTNSKKYDYVVTTVDVNGVESLPSLEVTATGGSLTTTGDIKIAWAAAAGAEYYRIYKDPSEGTDFYGWIGDTNTLSFRDFNFAPDLSDAPPEDRTPFSGADNKPSAVTYYQQRKAFANSTNNPQTVNTTQSGIYNSLRTSRPARADDAITFTINARELNAIRHIVSLSSMLLLTSSGVWRVTEGQDKVLTPAAVGVEKQSNYGSSKVAPVIAGDTLLYVQDKGTKVRDLNYRYSDDDYQGTDLSLIASHLFDGYEIEEMSYAEEPYGIVWCVRSDGRLLGLTYQKEHKVWAWHQHITGVTDEFESVATISEDGRDATYVIVKRTIDGNTVRYVERFEPRADDASANAFCVDSGLTYDGVPATLITGLDHLDGEDVAVLADGNVVVNLTVGVITGGIGVEIPNASSKVTVGISYLPVIELLDIDISSSQETLKFNDLSVSKVMVEVEKSRGGWVGPVDDDGVTGEMIEIKPRRDSDGYDSIELRSFKEEVTIQSDWSKGGALRIEQRDPLPLSILSVIPKIDVS